MEVSFIHVNPPTNGKNPSRQEQSGKCYYVRVIGERVSITEALLSESNGSIIAPQC